MKSIDDIKQKILAFRDDRNWQQFHDPKNLATAISIEAAELNELFLWKNVEESYKVDKEKIKDELADVLNYCFLLAEQQGFDISEIMMDKIKKNEEKYPVSKSKGTAKKYNEL